MLECITQAGVVLPLSLTLASAPVFFSVFLVWRRFEAFIAGQAAIATAIIVLIVSMDCPMFAWLWIYLGILSSGLLVLSVTRYWLARSVRSSTVSLTSSTSTLAKEFAVPIRIIDTQKVRAFAYRRAVYLSIGLLEQLEPEEIRAVVAHEVYHLKHSPNRLLSCILAIGSLTFVPFSDEGRADRYAADVTGNDELARALQKLDVVSSRQRIRDIFKST
ncbi:MAG: M48 family metalloprotease [Halobacteriota archaeon]